MILFHGTSSKRLPALKRKRVLLPRGDKPGIYTGKLASNPTRVYLTDTYALRFAEIACEEIGGYPVVVSCKVDETLLLPDTDFVEGGTHRLRVASWQESLELTGCVSVEGPVPIFRIYLCKGAKTDDKMWTGMLHTAIGKRVREHMHYILGFSPRYAFSEDWGWEKSA